MSTPFALVASLQLPGDSGLPVDPIPFNVSSAFTSEADVVLNLTGTGTKSVPFGSIGGAGALGVFIKVDPSASAQPIQVKVNGSSTGLLEISPGGCLCYMNPNPTAGITQLDIVYPTSCVVKCWVLG